MKSQTITLKKPIEFGSDVISEITLTRPTLGEMMPLDDAKGPMSQLHAMIVICGDQPKPVIDLVDPDDFQQLSDAVAGFFPDALPTGEN